MRVSINQGSPEWKAWRKNGIGGSEIGAIMGVSPWKTIHQLYIDKTEGERDFTNAAMEKGKKYEQEAIFSYEKETNNWVQPDCFQDDEVSYFLASLDGISFDEKLMVEIKVPWKASLKTIESGQISNQYYYQCQWYMMITKAEICHLYTYCTESKKGHLINILADPELWKEMREKASHFWNNHVLKRIPPEKKASSLPIVEDDKFLQKEMELKRVRDSLQPLKDLEKLEEKLEKDLIEMTGRSSCRGKYFEILRTEAKGFVDYEKIPQLVGVDLDMYRKKPIEKFKIKSL